MASKRSTALPARVSFAGPRCYEIRAKDNMLIAVAPGREVADMLAHLINLGTREEDTLLTVEALAERLDGADTVQEKALYGDLRLFVYQACVSNRPLEFRG